MESYTEYPYFDSHLGEVHKYLRNPVLNFLKKVKAKTILDIGCGNGAFAMELLKEGYDVYGIDASRSGIAIAKQLYPKRFFLQNVHESCLPEEIRDIKFDTIISTEVIEHLYDPVSFIQFCKHILSSASGGSIIISTPYHGYLKNLCLSLANKWDAHLDPFWTGGHIKFWSKDTLRKLLILNGFQDIEFAGAGRMPFLWKSLVVKGRI
ncbi:class I SAM-dependent methyltransferase [Thermoflavifilum thermophilum]|uniref:2-polyprenyl-3-methyl-5-hydroxy-6-metoxy-1,4-benzoquinol methylase n=1 Tax=Thermoflavifilum thermophilum TaxID=1393122 RepID=A0A1I7N9L2_9BACT|nr:class I SAM-dependent methyltransferase [Thermoflavifilum thermophilum]SFV31349.1 2-polyprenyl-3-methyl-5-hydroxy-6-metoxy-1,4-benzoquinol methylase [Thermoflavifilum thermophilum]